MKKYEHKRIKADCSLDELSKERNEGWVILLKENHKGEECYLVEREIKQRTNNKTPIERRKSIFKGRVSCYLSQYSSHLLNEFYEYWSEHGEKDIKMRFEKEKSFDIDRRLKTWQKRSNSYNKTNTKSVNSSW